MTELLCKLGQRLAFYWNDICIKKNGDCTPLYYHISDCEECATLREKFNEQQTKGQ